MFHVERKGPFGAVGASLDGCGPRLQADWMDRKIISLIAGAAVLAGALGGAGGWAARDARGASYDQCLTLELEQMLEVLVNRQAAADATASAAPAIAATEAAEGATVEEIRGLRRDLCRARVSEASRRGDVYGMAAAC